VARGKQTKSHGLAATSTVVGFRAEQGVWHAYCECFSDGEGLRACIVMLPHIALHVRQMCH